MGPFDQVEGANYIFIGELIVVVKEARGQTANFSFELVNYKIISFHIFGINLNRV